MSAITGTEPTHWHDEHGRHRMPDPRAAFGHKWQVATGDWTDEDERAYVRHLIEHDSSTEPLPNDPEAVRVLLEHIASLERTVAVERELVRKLRERHRREQYGLRHLCQWPDRDHAVDYLA